tara:strand:+ start:185 stop:1906 length:1722 start_codon:yes stop_codon:yes gene_type:complete
MMKNTKPQLYAMAKKHKATTKKTHNKGLSSMNKKELIFYLSSSPQKENKKTQLKPTVKVSKKLHKLGNQPGLYRTTTYTPPKTKFELYYKALDKILKKYHDNDDVKIRIETNKKNTKIKKLDIIIPNKTHRNEILNSLKRKDMMRPYIRINGRVMKEIKTPVKKELTEKEFLLTSLQSQIKNAKNQNDLVTISNNIVTDWSIPAEFTKQLLKEIEAKKMKLTKKKVAPKKPVKKKKKDKKIGSNLDKLSIEQLIKITDEILCDINKYSGEPVKKQTEEKLKKYNISKLTEFKKYVLKRVKEEGNEDNLLHWHSYTSCFGKRFKPLEKLIMDLQTKTTPERQQLYDKFLKIGHQLISPKDVEYYTLGNKLVKEAEINIKDYEKLLKNNRDKLGEKKILELWKIRKNFRGVQDARNIIKNALEPKNTQLSDDWLGGKSSKEKLFDQIKDHGYNITKDKFEKLFKKWGETTLRHITSDYPRSNRLHEIINEGKKREIRPSELDREEMDYLKFYHYTKSFNNKKDMEEIRDHTARTDIQQRAADDALRYLGSRHFFTPNIDPRAALRTIRIMRNKKN